MAGPAQGAAPRPESRPTRLLLAEGEARRLVLSTLHASESPGPRDDTAARALCVSPSGDRLLCAESGAVVLRRDDGRLVRRLTTGAISQPTFAHDGSALAWLISEPTQAVQLAKAPSWKKRTLSLPAGTKAVIGHAAPADGEVLATLDTQTGPVIARMPMDGGAPELVALSAPAVDVAAFAGAVYFTRRDTPGLWSVKAGARNDAEALCVSKLWIRSGSLRVAGTTLLFLGAESVAAATTDGAELHAVGTDGVAGLLHAGSARDWAASADGTVALLGAKGVRLLRPIDCDTTTERAVPEGNWRLVGFLR